LYKCEDVRGRCFTRGVPYADPDRGTTMPRRRIMGYQVLK
jgi:hypothetical protein